MWTHYIFLILSMLTGDSAEAAVEPAVMAPQTEPAQLAASPVETQPVTPKPAAKRTSKKRPAAKSQTKKARRTPRSSAEAPMPAAKTPAAHGSVVVMQPMTRVALAPDANVVIGKVQDFYNQTKSFTASFTQTVTNQTFNKLKPKVSKGRVYILKPGKMRWDYKNKSYRSPKDPKVSKSFISDGKHLWAVMHKNKQYYKEDLTGSALPVAVSFLMGTGDLRKEFDVAFDTAGKFGSKSDILLLLTPKNPSARYKKLWLVVDATDHSVKQSVVLNSKGDTNAIRFTSTKVNDTSLKNGHFIFNAKANKGFRLIKPPKAK